MTVLGQVKGDGEPTCFSNAKDTGIPDLQQWCHQLTVSSRERAARNFLAHLKTFTTSVQSYVQGIGDVTAVDREALREKWESGNLDKGYENNDGRSDDGYGAWANSDDGDPFAAILGGLGGSLGAELYSASLLDSPWSVVCEILFISALTLSTLLAGVQPTG